MKKMAIVCDWLITYAGAEKVLENMLICYPHADIFAVVDFASREVCPFLQNKKIQTSFIQKLPFAKQKYRYYFPLMPLAIEQLDVSSYDIVLSSSHAVAKGILTGPNQLHISYVHSPMRYAWDLQHQYLKESNLEKGTKGFIAQYFLHKMRLWDQRTAHSVDYFIANSDYIAKRIWKTYRREAHVIYPPVAIEKFSPDFNKENFYLAVSRLVPYKKMHVIVEAFANMPEKKLIVIGDGPDMEKLKEKTAENIQMLGYQTTENLKKYYQKAKALIFAAEEDFGIVPVEAQACGTPIIAFGKGGALETVQDESSEKPTGVFFREQTASAICESVQYFEKHSKKFTSENCLFNAKRFSEINFQKQITEFIEAKQY